MWQWLSWGKRECLCGLKSHDNHLVTCLSGTDMTWIPNRVENIMTGYTADGQVKVDVFACLSMLILGCIIFLRTCPSSCVMDRWEPAWSDNILWMCLVRDKYVVKMADPIPKKLPSYTKCKNNYVLKKT